MIGVFAKASVVTEAIEEFEASAHALVQATRANDAGLVSYDFGALVEEGAEGEYAFLECWESQEALEAHMQQAHFKDAVAQWQDYLADELEMRTYQF